MANDNTYSEEIRTLRDATGFTTQIFGDDYADISDYLINVAGQETLYGTLSSQVYDDGTPVSITPWQIDPIKYADFLERGEGGEAKKRIELINETFTNMGYRDFDIRKIASLDTLQSHVDSEGKTQYDLRYKDVDSKLVNDPYVTAALARTIIASDKDPVPEDLVGQANLWKKNWNTESGAGTPEEFLEKHSIYRESTGVEDNVMDLLVEQDADLFKISKPDLSEPAISTRVK